MRYLKGAPWARIQYGYQSKRKGMTVWADSDFAGCEKSRKSTSAGAIQLGGSLLKRWSSSQAVIAMLSGEAEYHALMKSVSISIGVESMLGDLGLELEDMITVKSDAGAAIGIAD